MFAVGASLVVSGWYFIQNKERYGDPLASHATVVYFTKIGLLDGHPYEIGNPWRLVFGHVPQLIVDSFWYESGWNTFRWPLAVDILFALRPLLPYLVCCTPTSTDATCLPSFAIPRSPAVGVASRSSGRHIRSLRSCGSSSDGCVGCLGTTTVEAAFSMAASCHGTLRDLGRNPKRCS